ncbi:alpha/beta hydrolase [Thalassobaculum sp.]|uniref:alpha/beta hydrolase n=1 Tax=Thalassobaculum sp. TaxID=2022740 RepID=UPI0032EAFFDC
MGGVIGIAAGAAAAWTLLVLVLFLLQRQILFVPDTTRPEPGLDGPPTMTRVHATTIDGLSLEGWWYPPPDVGLTIVYFHGNAGHVGTREAKAQRLIARGYGVLLAGYRGYGGNPGRPSETGLIRDGHGWLTAVESLGVERDAVLLYGESLGSGVVAALAQEHSVAGVVLEAPYTSIADIAASQYWYVPVRRLLLDRFDTLSRIPGVRAPVLIVHGTEDRVIPVEHGARVYAAASEPKRFARLEGGGHSNLFDHGALEALDDFVNELVRPAP